MVNPLTWKDPLSHCSFTINYADDAKTILSVQIIEQDGSKRNFSGTEIQYLPNEHYANSEDFNGTRAFFICLTTDKLLYLSPPSIEYFNEPGISRAQMKIRGVYDPSLEEAEKRREEVAAKQPRLRR